VRLIALPSQTNNGNAERLRSRSEPALISGRAGDPVQLSPVRTTNAGRGFHGFFGPTAPG
jgi:hypothetical protein